MAQNTVYKWPVQNMQAVCKTQDVAAGKELILNGMMAVTGSADISFIRAGFSRSVSISSTNNLAGATFTVIGIQNGGRIEENIAGPNTNTIYTTEIFDVITSVSVDNNVTNVQVGTGDTGFLPLINASPNFSVLNIRNTNGLYALSVIPLDAGVPSNDDGITYTVFNTLENTDNNGVSFVSQLDRFFVFEKLENKGVKNLIQNINLTNYILIQITATAAVTNTLEAIFMQS